MGRSYARGELLGLRSRDGVTKITHERAESIARRDGDLPTLPLLDHAAMTAGAGTGAFRPGAWLSGTQPFPATRRRALGAVFEGADVGEDVAQLGRVVRRTGPRAATDVATVPPTGALNAGTLSRLGTGGTAALLARQAGVSSPYGLGAAGLAGTLAGPASLDALNQISSPFLRALALGERTSLPYGAMVAGQNQGQRIPDWRLRNNR